MAGAVLNTAHTHLAPWVPSKSKTPRQGTARPEGTGGSLGTGAPGGQGRRWGLHRGVAGAWAMALDLAGPTEGSRGLPLSAVSPGDAVGTRLPAEAVSHRAGDPEGMNSHTICRLPVCRSGPAGRAGPALRAGRVGAPHVAPGPTSRARHREAGDVPAGTRSRSGSLRGPRWSGRKQASPVGRDSAPLWGLSRGFSEVRLPRGCRRQGILRRAAAGGHGGPRVRPCIWLTLLAVPAPPAVGGSLGPLVPAPGRRAPDFLPLGGS